MTQQIISSISKPLSDVSLPLPLAHFVVLYPAEVLDILLYSLFCIWNTSFPMHIVLETCLKTMDQVFTPVAFMGLQMRLTKTLELNS